MLLKGLNKKRPCTRNNDYNLCECYLYPSMRKKEKRHLAKRSYNYGLPCPEKSREKEWDERYKHQPNNVQVAMVQKKKRKQNSNETLTKQEAVANPLFRKASIYNNDDNPFFMYT